ncbi:MAG TPA: alpha/beta hydrolase domain-containing protein [Acidimicrobiia bacterium]|nr:alpha/beta hydrolase domain-containing protein [Acidimicrobiia bacterium]
MRQRTPGFLASALVVVAATMSTAGAESPSRAVPVPAVEGPVTGGSRTGGPYWATPFDLRPSGYVEEEYFLSGTASDRGLSGTEHTAPYKVRILVRRPADPARFNGTAVLEWFNVSLQSEVEHDWAADYPALMRDGYVSAAVSAQMIGVQSASPMSLRNWDPQRYGSLQHPGDDYSYDIFAQAAQALRSGLVAGHLPVGVVLGTGTSQSCLRLVTYISRLAAADGVFDGYHPTLCPATAEVPDTLVPIVWATSEWEAALQSRPDGPLLRVWEIAGTSHANHWEVTMGGAQGFRDGSAVGGTVVVPAQWDEDHAGQYGERGSHPSNLAPARYAFRAAIDGLNRWARDWKAVRAGRLGADQVRAAPAAGRLARDGLALRRDEYGNAAGGVRLPALDVPVATYRGEFTDGAGGYTTAFDQGALTALYPSHDAYVTKMRAATDAAVAGGFMLAGDVGEWMQRVTASPISRR